MDGATLAAPSLPTCEFTVADLTGVEERTAQALDIAGEVWGVEPGHHLRGWTITCCGVWFLCESGCTACWTYGCERLDREVITAAENPETRCLPGVLIHELGHLVVGDRSTAIRASPSPPPGKPSRASSSGPAAGPHGALEKATDAPPHPDRVTEGRRPHRAETSEHLVEPRVEVDAGLD